jgi:predicted nucleic acid-binding protein
MIGRVFVDTSVLVWARDVTGPDEQHERWHGCPYYVTVTQKLSPHRDVTGAREDVASLVTWRPIPADLGTMDAAWAIEDRFGLSWWDSLIVAAAQLGGCTHLLTEDLSDGQSFDGVLVISPFAHAPEQILDA